MFENFFGGSGGGGGGGGILNDRSHHGHLCGGSGGDSYGDRDGSHREFFGGSCRGFFSRWRSSDSGLYSQFHLILPLFDILLIS
ncbi:hypothetical protein I7I50_07413 [Histoplasma capsulatum G186AR]|uniref:Uncharacterized protein n=1 Tax=Ajellomyces capsulatus TaxID=5037 RepID=A0A8H7YVE4_AJECA|nr:hypothetical protein I7I52_09515 [Histoplasma capsulatum]QSS68120.1 hypothetical protein I7I50_07413 [Histoplasma capsulatum G186AR]